MRIHLTKVSFGVILISLIALSGCSKAEPPATRSEVAPASPTEETPAPTPTVGAVEGKVTGEKSAAPLGSRLVVLCELADGPACRLRPAYSSTTDAAGTFAIHDVVPGRYTLLHGATPEGPSVQLEDGLAIDPTRGEIKVLSGTMVDIGDEGLENIRGAVEYMPAGLTFEFREGRLAEIEILAGETVEANIEAWGM